MNPSEPLRDQLRQLACVVEQMEDSAYPRATPEGGGSVGSHVRHCLDHVEALLRGAAEGRLDYDRRARGSVVETDRRAALKAIARLDGALAALGGETMDRPLRVVALLSPGAAPVEMASTLGREMAYVVSHTTHHNALIGWLVRAAGLPVPRRFGYAAATLAWMDAASCAP